MSDLQRLKDYAEINLWREFTDALDEVDVNQIITKAHSLGLDSVAHDLKQSWAETETMRRANHEAKRDSEWGC